MITPVFSVIAATDDIHPPIFNVRQLQPVLWVKLPDTLTQLDVSSVVSESGHNLSWTRDGHQSWLYIDISELSLSVGYHTYQINLTDNITNWATSVYFAYIIQTDTPDEPYYYMGIYREGV